MREQPGLSRPVAQVGLAAGTFSEGWRGQAEPQPREPLHLGGCAAVFSFRFSVRVDTRCYSVLASGVQRSEFQLRDSRGSAAKSGTTDALRPYDTIDCVPRAALHVPATGL